MHVTVHMSTRLTWAFKPFVVTSTFPGEQVEEAGLRRLPWSSFLAQPLIGRLTWADNLTYL